MSDITTYEILEREIENAGGRPTVLEALWDGDTEGWFLVLNLYFETGRYFWKSEKIKRLGVVSFGGDNRLFSGAVPAWPEAECTKEWGKRLPKNMG
ncbi:hypothetical protein [Paraflavitalea speifideaquila]|uniref:hypothetical protein n=1 Tax=Paraflavitalea speifideaquila TaxID=3076558 RepID=UPI0028E359C5|nr:hypothetical protein [Paraflavitalea speifideiaquila]